MNGQTKKRFWTAIFLTGGLVLVGFGFFRLWPDEQPVETLNTNPDHRDDAIKQVRVVALERGVLVRNTWLTGEITAARKVNIAPRLGARLQKMRDSAGKPIEEGTEVVAGAVVAWLESDDLQAAVEMSQASLHASRASLQVARVIHADATRERDRWLNLRKQGVGTEQNLEQAVTAYERSQAELDAASQRMAQAEASLRQAEVNLRHTRITAPFSGIVSRKYVDEGAFVSPGTPLFSLIDITRVEVSGGLAGRHYSLLKPGQTKVTTVVDAYPEKDFTGQLTRLHPELSSGTRTVNLTISLENPEQELKPGMFARMAVTLEEKPDTLLLPQNALVTGFGEPLVYIVDQNRKIQAAYPRLGLREGPLHQVLEGLREGDLVVVSGHRMLEPGMRVEPILQE